MIEQSDKMVTIEHFRVAVQDQREDCVYRLFLMRFVDSMGLSE